MSAQAGPGPSTSAHKQSVKNDTSSGETSSQLGLGSGAAGTSTAAVLAPVGGTGAAVQVSTEPNIFTDAQLDEFKEQDRYLPIANVGRIMKNALPTNAKIAKEAKECAQECVSEFISFLSSEAADKVLTDKRKTINGEDILYAMTALGFDNYQEAGRVYLAKYRNYINENPHRSSHHDRPSATAPHSNQTSNRATPQLDLDSGGSSFLAGNNTLDSSGIDGNGNSNPFGGAFNAFVNRDQMFLEGDDAELDGGEDDDDDEDEDDDDEDEDDQTRQDTPASRKRTSATSAAGKNQAIPKRGKAATAASGGASKRKATTTQVTEAKKTKTGRKGGKR